VGKLKSQEDIVN